MFNFTIKNSIKYLNSDFLMKIFKRSNSQVRSKELASYLRSKIRMKGPITVGEFMKEALTNPVSGYYMKKDVFGVKGDFITAPEVSQMFGEIIGIWFLNEWLFLKRVYGSDMPKSVQMFELGPGRGTLMADMLSVWSKQSKETSGSELFVYLVETSPYLRKIQMRNLCERDEEPKLFESYPTKFGKSTKVTWLSDLSEMPHKEAAHFFLANEFFDALPVQKFQKTTNGFREILIDFDSETDKLEFKLSSRTTVGSKIILPLHPNYEKFDHVEVSVESAKVVETISKRLSDYNGSALFIDYGHDGQCKDTLRAFKDHKLVDVFETPGDCDLTVDVDFALLKHIAQKFKIKCYGPIEQGDYLQQMHIGQRFQALLRNCKKEEEKTKLATDLKMLVDKEKMGSRFKLLAMRKLDFSQPPPGFLQFK